MYKTPNFLLLDDIRNPEDIYGYTKNYLYRVSEYWDIVRGFNAFKKHITDTYKTYSQIPPLISFDYDLNSKYTGYDCAKWLVDFCRKNQIAKIEYVIHSFNPISYDSIKDLIDAYNSQSRKENHNAV